MEVSLPLDMIRTLHWTARRYCDGRMSYITGEFNLITRYLLEKGIKLDNCDETIWARDQMGRKYDNLTDEEAQMGDEKPNFRAEQEEIRKLRSKINNITNKVIRAVFRWIELAEEYGFKPTEANANHSALLQRLISGKEPLPEPPPLYLSYPDYHLVDTGYRNGCIVSGSLRDHLKKNPPYTTSVSINQDEWNIVEKTDSVPPEFIVKYRNQSQLYKLHFLPKNQLVTVNHGTHWGQELHGSWVLEKI